MVRNVPVVAFCLLVARAAEQTHKFVKRPTTSHHQHNYHIITNIMMKNTFYLVLLSLALATTASAERHSLRLRGASNNRDARSKSSSQGLTPSLSTEQELVDAAIQEAMQYEEEILELVESLETREAGIEMTAPHILMPLKVPTSTSRQERKVFPRPGPRLSGDSTDELFEKRAEGIEKTSPHEKRTNEAIKSANFYLESRAEGIAKTSPSSEQGQEKTRPSLRAFKNTETAMS